MTPTSTSDATGRRTLAQRIDRYLAALERLRRQPNRRESCHIRDALEHLRAGRHPEVEVALVKAEHAAPLPAHVAAMLETNQPITVEQLRDELEGIIREGA